MVRQTPEELRWINAGSIQMTPGPEKERNVPCLARPAPTDGSIRPLHTRRVSVAVFRSRCHAGPGSFYSRRFELRLRLVQGP